MAREKNKKTAAERRKEMAERQANFLEEKKALGFRRVQIFIREDFVADLKEIISVVAKTDQERLPMLKMQFEVFKKNIQRKN